jgi:hypothetical protein
MRKIVQVNEGNHDVNKKEDRKESIFGLREENIRKESKEG